MSREESKASSGEEAADATPSLSPCSSIPSSWTVSPVPEKDDVDSDSGTFVITLNRHRCVVSRAHPFLLPQSLFTSHGGNSAGCGVCSSSDLTNDVSPPPPRRPRHQYGDQPVLLLDYTGVLRIRRRRRQRRAQLKMRMAELTTKRRDAVKERQRNRMRRLRALRRWGLGQALALEAPEAFSDSGTCESRSSAAVMEEFNAVRREFESLVCVKRQYALTGKGSVLMLPSPYTGEVRLCAGHHYCTVCFVGEELREVLPGELHAPSGRPPPPPNAPPVEQPVRRTSARIDTGVANSPGLAVETAGRPPWAAAELLGYHLFLRECHRNRVPSLPRLEASLLDDKIDVDTSTDLETIGKKVNFSFVDLFLALPACEVAMYCDWAADRFDIPSLL